jgi:outer membrane protein OmpA-like peptidoglycan-associated protein
VKNIAALRFGALGVMLGGVVAACQPAAPSSELVTARRVYDQARQGAAAELDPTSVQEARAALDAAEAVHVEAPDSKRERSHAYISIRKSELALSRAREAGAREEQERIAQVRGAALNEGAAQQAQAELEQRERELRAVLVALAIAEAERRAMMDAMMEQEQSTVRVTGVFFETGRDELSTAARKQLDIVANELRSNPELSTLIEGFADIHGDEERNLELSERRASTVREYLSSRGVDAERLEAVGLGENYPVASNETPTGRAANRRVQISTGVDPSTSARALPPDAEEDAPVPEEPELEPTEKSPRQPVTGKDSDFPDDPKTREPDVEPR